MKQNTIGNVSRPVGLPTKTIRFYEGSGVLSAVGRGENGYRIYPDSVIEELKLLKYARDLGLPLSEIKKLMRGCEDGDCKHSEEYIEKSILNYLELLNKKIKQLTILKSRLGQLGSSLRAYAKTKDKSVFCCDLLHQLIVVTKRKEAEKNG